MQENENILVIVDSDKASIAAINNGRQPVHDEFNLPQGFTIAYATSDSGAESWINKEMKRRDKVSARAMKLIKGKQAFLAKLRESNSLYIQNIFE